tara:strand:- start:331 stop:534 length:204 start_codon:yes stop_codon:yes gene_type:complete
MLDHDDLKTLIKLVETRTKITEERYEKERELKMWESCKRIGDKIMEYEHITRKLKKMKQKEYNKYWN